MIMRPHKMLLLLKYAMLLYIFMCFIGGIHAQRVYEVKYKNQADIKIYVTKYKSQADLKVYKTAYKSRAKGNRGLWYFTNYPARAQKKVYFVPYKSQADLKIFFVPYKSQAGWQNKDKEYLIDHKYLK